MFVRWRPGIKYSYTVSTINTVRIGLLLLALAVPLQFNLESPDDFIGIGFSDANADKGKNDSRGGDIGEAPDPGGRTGDPGDGGIGNGGGPGGSGIGAGGDTSDGDSGGSNGENGGGGTSGPGESASEAASSGNEHEGGGDRRWWWKRT